MKKFNDEKWWYFCLDHCHKEDFVPINTQEIVMRGRNHGGHVFCLGSPLLCLEEVVTHGAADYAFPVLLQEDVSRWINQEEAVNHGWSEDGQTAERLWQAERELFRGTFRLKSDADKIHIKWFTGSNRLCPLMPSKPSYPRIQNPSASAMPSSPNNLNWLHPCFLLHNRCEAV